MLEGLTQIMQLCCVLGNIPFLLSYGYFFFLTDISIVILDLFYECWNHFLSLFFWIQMSQLIGLLGSNF